MTTYISVRARLPDCRDGAERPNVTQSVNDSINAG